MAAMALDGYVVDTLMPDLVGHDRQPSAFLVYLLLWRRTHGAGDSETQVSLAEIATLSLVPFGTALSPLPAAEANPQ